MSKVRCYDPKYLKGDRKNPGYNCAHFDQFNNVCLVKTIGGGKKANVFPSKSRVCPKYQEKEMEK